MDGIPGPDRSPSRIPSPSGDDLVEREEGVRSQLAFYLRDDIAPLVRCVELISSKALSQDGGSAFSGFIGELLSSLSSFVNLNCASFSWISFDERQLIAISAIPQLYFYQCSASDPNQATIMLSPARVVFDDVGNIHSNWIEPERPPDPPLPCLFNKCILDSTKLEALSVHTIHEAIDSWEAMFSGRMPRLRQLFFTGYWMDTIKANRIIKLCPNVIDFGWYMGGSNFWSGSVDMPAFPPKVEICRIIPPAIQWEAIRHASLMGHVTGLADPNFLAGLISLEVRFDKSTMVMTSGVRITTPDDIRMSCINLRALQFTFQDGTPISNGNTLNLVVWRLLKYTYSAKLRYFNVVTYSQEAIEADIAALSKASDKLLDGFRYHSALEYASVCVDKPRHELAICDHGTTHRLRIIVNPSRSCIVDEDISLDEWRTAWDTREHDPDKVLLKLLEGSEWDEKSQEISPTSSVLCSVVLYTVDSKQLSDTKLRAERLQVNL
jgi:hypothetical protein